MATKRAATKTKTAKAVVYGITDGDGWYGGGFDTREAALDYAAEADVFEGGGTVILLQEIGVYRQNNSYEEVTE